MSKAGLSINIHHIIATSVFEIYQSALNNLFGSADKNPYNIFANSNHIPLASSKELAKALKALSDQGVDVFEKIGVGLNRHSGGHKNLNDLQTSVFREVFRDTSLGVEQNVQ